MNYADPSGHDIIMIIGLICCFGILIAGSVVAVVGAVVNVLVEIVNRVFEAFTSSDGVDAFTNLFSGGAPLPKTYNKGPYDDDIKINWE